MDWVTAVERLRRDRQPGVLVTVVDVRGHAPREAGAKMVVGGDQYLGTSAAATSRRSPSAGPASCSPTGAAEPEMRTSSLNDKAPRRARRAVLRRRGDGAARAAAGGAVGGDLRRSGHVGLELARILARHDLDLHLVDSRAEQLAPDRLAPSLDRRAGPGARAPRAGRPSWCSASCPPARHVLIMTHDHAEDAALCDAALRLPGTWLDRADRVVGEVGAVPQQAGRRGARGRGHRPDHDARSGSRRSPARSRRRSP